MSNPPALDNDDHFCDRDFFDANPRRSCYARQHRDGWVLLVKRLPPPRRGFPVMLRTWAKLEQVPQGERACLSAWQRAAYPQP